MLRFRNIGKVFFSSRSSDPYFILGVQKNEQFTQIKKAYYKLANELHPDKNNTKEAQLKFIKVKQAYQAIKYEKGLMKPQNLYTSDDKQSMRPNPQKYRMQDEEQIKRDTDYKMQQEKAQSRQQFANFRPTFKTIDDINEIKIKVQDGELPDAAKRFGLQKLRMKIRKLSNSGNKSTYLLAFGAYLAFTLLNIFYAYYDHYTKLNTINHFSKVHQRKSILAEADENIDLKVKSLEKTPQIQQFINLEKQQTLKQLGRIKAKDKVIDLDNIDHV